MALIPAHYPTGHTVPSPPPHSYSYVPQPIPKGTCSDGDFRESRHKLVNLVRNGQFSLEYLANIIHWHIVQCSRDIVPIELKNAKMRFLAPLKPLKLLYHYFPIQPAATRSVVIFCLCSVYKVELDLQLFQELQIYISLVPSFSVIRRSRSDVGFRLKD